MLLNLTRNEDYRPADNEKVVFPTGVVKAQGGGLEEDESSCLWSVKSRPEV